MSHLTVLVNKYLFEYYHTHLFILLNNHFVLHGIDEYIETVGPATLYLYKL